MNEWWVQGLTVLAICVCGAIAFLCGREVFFDIRSWWRRRHVR